MAVNPPWVRDEFILALDVYFRHNPNTLNKNHEAILQLSKVLRELPIHAHRPNQDTFRNPSGTLLHVKNFMHYDGYSRKPVNGARLEKIIWEQFSVNKKTLNSVANAILRCYNMLYVSISNYDIDIKNFFEGQILYRLHRQMECEEKILTILLHKIKSLHKYQCDICGFQFHEVYGQAGEEYIEFHHTVPVVDYYPDMPIYPADFIQVCANCHKMLHRIRPWVIKTNMRTIIRGNKHV